ncbi:hypothetical protein GCM10009760_36260 [Kitasatospora kazusensis]|uniref:Uncharacterized protein n=1 Tax=Kitasatospora kazusensis TaxID=407974 RepID=A0ABN2ZRN9_9ACTN
MTTQGERDPRPAGQQSHVPTRIHRARRSPRRVLLGCTLAVAAAGVGWIVAGSQVDAGSGGSSTATNVPAIGATPAEPLTEAQSFTADRYFPPQRGIDLFDYKAKRTTARQSATCADALFDRTHDVLRDTGCQGYVGVGFSRLDQQVVTSLVVLRFADPAAAAKAAQAVGGNPEALVFVLAPPLPGGPSAAPHPGGKEPTSSRVQAVGHYLTVTVSRYADPGAANPAGEAALDAATRAVSFTAEAPFAWL